MPPIGPKDVKNQQSYADAIGISNKQLKTAIKLVKEFGKQSSKNLKSNVKYLSDFTDELDDGVNKIKDMSKEVNKLHLKDALDTEEAAKLNSQLGKLQKKMTQIYKRGPEGENQWLAQKKAVSALKKEIDGVEKEIKQAQAAGRSFTDVMAESGPGFLKNWARFRKEQEAGNTGMQKYGGLIRGSAKSLEKLPGLLKLSGKAAKGLGGALGGVSKIFASWPGAVLMGVKALWDVGMAADQFVKDANKSFAYVRGPDIMTSDIKGQFKEFNNQIYQAGENIRVGLDATQIRELMEATMQAGLNIQTLNKGLLTYRDAVYVASKASKTLGMVLPQVGQIMGELITDFRMDLEKVDKTFVQVAFDAKKSGLSTDRFWGTVQNATASLALYGVFVDSASKTMKAFTESAVGGAKESAEATENMYDVFKQEGIANKAAIIDLAKAGGQDFRKAFEAAAGDLAERNVQIQERIQIEEAKKSPDAEQIKKLRAELYANQARMSDYLSVSAKSGVEQSTYLGALAGDAPDILMNLLKGIGSLGRQGDLSTVSNQKMLVLLKAAKERGISETNVKMLIGNAKATRKKMEHLVSLSGEHFKNVNKMDGDNRKRLTESIERVMNTSGDNQIEAMDTLASELSEILGITDYQARIYADMVKLDKKAGTTLTNLMNGDKKSLAELKKIAVSQQMVQSLTSDNFKKQEKTDGAMADAAEDTFQGIVDQTLSFKEMTEIAKDEIKWRASSLGVFQSLNTGVFSIFKWLTRKQPGYMSESQKAAQQLLKASLTGNTALEKLVKFDKKGNITAKSQLALSQKISEEMDTLDKTLKVQRGVQAVLGGVTMGKDPSAVLGEAIKTSSGELKATLEEQKSVFDNLQKITQSPAAGKGAIKSLEKTLGNLVDPKEKEELLDELSSINSSTMMGNKKKKKVDDLRNRLLKSIVKKNDDTIKQNEKDKQIQKDMQDKLKRINKNNALVAKFSELQMRQSPEAMKALAKDFKARLKPGASSKDIAELADSFGLDLEVLKEAYKEAKFGGIDKIQKAIETRERLAETVTGIGKKVAGIHGMATLAEPVKVSSPGAVVLHPGEMILPKVYSDFKTIPAMPSPVGTTPGGGGTKEITVNVSATEKDLGQKIANKVREVLYTNQVSGMG